MALSQAKEPIPDEAAQKVASELIAEVYKSDLDAAKTVEQKVELASKILRDGIATTDDPTARYVMLRIARDIAVEQGDLVTALDAIEWIVQGFEADKFELQLDAATAVAKVLRLPADQSSFAFLLIPVMDTAIDADRYEHAKSLGALALSSARRARDRDRIEEIVTKTKEIDEIASEAVKVQAALDMLAASPSDPEANFAVGKFLCVVKGDWRRGVAMLALGSNEKYRSAARLELEGAPDALALGDAWWEIADELEGSAKSRTQAHAGQWYRKALPTLSGLTKVRVEKAIASLPPEAQWIDLLAMVDVSRDAVRGKWTQTRSAVQISESLLAQLTLPSALPKNYDLEVSFTRTDKNNDVSVMIPVGPSHCFCLLSGYRGEASGLQVVGGKDIRQNPTSVKPGALINGRRYMLRISVEVADDDQSAIVSVRLDGRPRHSAFRGMILGEPPSRASRNSARTRAPSYSTALACERSSRRKQSSFNQSQRVVRTSV
jgi:hypothetical protein